ncbi:hypothetical protein AHAS_Ahas13G0148400 [Arachis hypogaea]
MLNKDTDATSKDTPQNGGDKQPPNTKILEVIRKQQNRLKQLEQEAERNLRRETSHDDDSHKDKDPFTKEIMKAKVPKDFKAPDMTPYDGTSDPSHHLSNFRSRMYLTEASDAIRYFPSRRTKPSTPQVY